jgi:hypothetical protein
VLITPRIVEQDDAHCEGLDVQRDYLERQDLYRDKMSPLTARHLAIKHLRQARSAWRAGDVKNAFRYANVALHHDPDNLETLRLRREIVQAHPELDVPLRRRLREGLQPWNHPHGNYPRKGVPWQQGPPAPIVPASAAPDPGRPGRVHELVR